MVRLEIHKLIPLFIYNNSIYIPVWLDQKLRQEKRGQPRKPRFTFQYGQIRNLRLLVLVLKLISHLHSSMVRLEMYKIQNQRAQITGIYIPVWLDQKFGINKIELRHLKIYIPVWLDQKYLLDYKLLHRQTYLHSSMVRLEMQIYGTFILIYLTFTFQYGQIRNENIKSGFVRQPTFTFQYGQIRNF